MVYVAATFIIVLALVLGIHWVLIGRPEALERGKLHKRLRTSLGQRPAKRIDFVKQAEKLSAVKGLDVILARTSGVASSLQSLIARADLNITVGRLLLTSACLFLGAWVLVAWITRLPWLGLAVGVMLAWLPFAVVRYKAAKRLQKFEEQFPEAIDLIARTLRAGHAFTSGLAVVAEEAPQPMAGEFRVVYDQQNYGMPLPDALKALAERIQLLDARFFVTAVLTQRESGGNLAEILGNLATVIRERFKVKRQVRVVSAHGRITGWVLSGLPPSLAVAFMIMSPNHIMTMVNDPMGLNMIFGALFLQVTGTLIIRRLVNIKYDEDETMMTPVFLFALGAFFVSLAFAAGWVTLEVLHRRAPARQRLRGLGSDGVGVLAASLPLAVDELDPRLARANRYLPKSPKNMSRLQKRMARAGFRGPMPTILYAVAEFGLPVLLVGLCLYFLGMTIGLLIGALLGIMGFMLPSFWLSRQISKRQTLIGDGLPDALDLLIVCVEAGMGLDQGIAKAAEELAVSHAALSEELATITTEIRAGKPRLEAFKNFAERTKVDDVRQLVSLLAQTDRFGTSISQALRTQAEVSRTMRRQRAEERAGKLGVKLVFPLVFCLFPAMYVVTLGPAVVKFVRFFAGMN